MLLLLLRVQHQMTFFTVCLTECVIAGRVLQCRESGLHHRSQRVARLAYDRHRHTVSLSVSGSNKMLLNVPA